MLLLYCTLHFSFHPKLAFYAKWKYAWPAILLTAIPFILWDIYFTKIGVWGFTPDYVSGLYIHNLPVEEILFFICIPYSCLFTIHCFDVLVKTDYFFKSENWITVFLLLLLTLLGLYYHDRLYTVITFFVLALLLLYLKFIVKVSWLSRFYFSYLILLFPFTIVNGILTGTGIDKPVVWYNNEENMGLRIATIPFEDIFYGMLLILLATALYNHFRKRYAA